MRQKCCLKRDITTYLVPERGHIVGPHLSSQLYPAAFWQPADDSRSNSTVSAHGVQGTCPCTDHSTSPNPATAPHAVATSHNPSTPQQQWCMYLPDHHTSPSPSNSTAWMITEAAASCTHTRRTATAHANILHGAVQMRCTCAVA